MKFNLTIISFLVFSILSKAQERKMPIGNNVFLIENSKYHQQNEGKTLGKKSTSDIPFIDFFNNKNTTKPNPLLWLDNDVVIENLNAIFDSKSELGVNYNTGFNEADVLTSKLLNTTNAGGNAFVHINFSTGNDWQTNDSLVFQVKGNSGVWNTLWVNSNDVNKNKDVFFNINFFDDLKSNLLQFRFVSYFNTNSDKPEVFKVHKLVISYKNVLPFYESFRQYDAINKTPLNTKWINFTNNVTPNDSNFMLWGNSIIFNSITDIKDSSYNNNNGLYGNADTLLSNPIDLSKTIPTEQIVMSFWIRGFKQMKANDSIYLETLDNLGRWQRAWASAKMDTNYTKISVSINGGRLRHPFFAFRFINKGTYLNSEIASFAIAALKITTKRELPLFDDFSSSSDYYPNQEIWLDNKVFINNNFPKNQPSLNVATFDGLDEFGNAYSKLPIKGTADVLTSKGYNLSTFALKDSIYFSFYYQYQLQGTTGQIYPTDSLVLEFKSTPNDADSFTIVWQKSALDTLPYDTFNRVHFAVPSKYLHDDFQIKFRNVGSLSGNLSQWHIDYIKLDAGRSLKDTFNDDLAISATPTSMLKKYRSMPWKHFIKNKVAYTNDSLYFSVFNNNNRNYSVDYKRQLIDNEQSIVFTKNSALGSVPFSVTTPLILTSPSPTNLTTTSTNLVKTFSNKISVSNNGFAGIDNVSTNDSITTSTKFSNYFAYDDGSAEAGYGIYLKNNGAVALGYDLEQMDTIYGAQIFFNQSENNVSTRKFDLVIWDNITPINQPATLDRILYRKNGISPIYTNTINGFATILFDSAIIVPKRFYIGWEQLGQFVLNIGLDENYYVGNKFVTNPNMFYKTDGFWLPTEIPGALMIRPLLGQFKDVPTNTKEITKGSSLNFSLYPNPTSGNITIETEGNDNLNMKLFDLMGNQIIETNISNNINTINLPTLSTGIYLIKVTNLKTGANQIKKLIFN